MAGCADVRARGVRQLKFIVGQRNEDGFEDVVRQQTDGKNNLRGGG